MLAMGVLMMLMPPTSSDSLLFHGGNAKQIMSRYSRWWSDQLKQDKKAAAATPAIVDPVEVDTSTNNIPFDDIEGVDAEDVAIFVNKVAESACTFDDEDNFDELGAEDDCPELINDAFEDEDEDIDLNVSSSRSASSKKKNKKSKKSNVNNEENHSLSAYLAEHGIAGYKISSHTYRKSGVTSAVNEGVSIPLTMNRAGMSLPGMLKIYAWIQGIYYWTYQLCISYAII